MLPEGHVALACATSPWQLAQAGVSSKWCGVWQDAQTRWGGGL